MVSTKNWGGGKGKETNDSLFSFFLGHSVVNSQVFTSEALCLLRTTEEFGLGKNTPKVRERENI